jgi:hypothetical protein
MGHNILIEDIAGRRRRQGIDDPDLRNEIRGLAIGDLVRLTLRGEQSESGETVSVRITDMTAEGFRGALVAKPTSKALAGLGVGFAIAFIADHIHSVAHERRVGHR